MEVTALCFRLLFYILVFLFAEDQHCFCDGITDAASLHVNPNRLQFFEYESIRISCEGFGDPADWRVLRRTREGVETICGSFLSKGPCIILNAFLSDNGEYLCEAGGNRSSSVNISITDGPVILESPALPVMDGESVTLSCRTKTASFLPVADFYKDGVLIQTGYNGSMTIHKVSKSDEGLYRCFITGAGESAESWMAVRETQPSHHRSTHLFLLGVTVVLVLWTVSLLVLGIHFCKKKREAVPGVAADPEPRTTDEYVYYCTIDDDVTESRV